MASLNKVLILGNLGNDPEKKEFPSGQSVVRFSVATNESWFDKTAGTRQERTEWHKVVVFGRLGDQCMQFLKKGRTVFVEGRLQTSSWEDKQSGQKRFMTEVIANTVEFIGGQGQGQGQGQGRTAGIPSTRPWPSRSAATIRPRPRSATTTFRSDPPRDSEPLPPPASPSRNWDTFAAPRFEVTPCGNAPPGTLWAT